MKITWKSLTRRMVSACIVLLSVIGEFRFAQRIFSSVVLASLLLTTIFVGGEQRASARTKGPISQSASVAVQPEPFIYNASPRSSSVLTIALLSRFVGLFSSAPVPGGFPSIKSPTLAEHIGASVSSMLAVVVPSAPEPPPPPPNAGRISYDFVGDSKADIGRWHPANTEVRIKETGGGSTPVYTVGTSSAKAAPGDFNGDGKTDAGTFDAGTWKYKTSTGGSEQTVSYGMSGDIPVAGDYDADGTTDVAVFRPSSNVWYMRKSSDLSTVTLTFGTSGDITIPGDYDGDAKTDVAIFRPSDGYWHIQGSTAGYYYFGWGTGGDVPVQGDFDGDGKSDPAVFRPSSGIWYAYRSALNNGSYYQQAWGSYADQPAPADYDGDGKTDYAIWRPTTGEWYILKSSNGATLYDVLGVPGDTAVPSAYTKQIGGSVTGYEMAGVRLNPKNVTGGTNLYSQNFGWGRSLVGLPGRAGLDAGFGLSYNSLVWIKNGSAMFFDPDTSNVTPGFRFGFPVIEPIYFDTAKSKWAYMMVSPSGGRVEFRQIGASSVYETADSTYSQLSTSGATNPNDPVEGIAITVTTTDGMQMTYAWNTGAYRCTQIKDRNGNYITIAYSSVGQLTTVTDTLGRVITVNYDTGGQPTTIQQTWKDTNGSGSNTTHTWATFAYTTQTVTTNFGSMAVVGPPNNTVLKVLQKVTHADGSYTKFLYNGYVQVKQIENYAADDHELNRVRTNLDSVSGAQSDCPRFTHTYTRAENFNLSGGTPQEIDVENLAPSSSSFTGPNGSESTSMVKVTMASHPDSLYTKIHFGPSGYKEGLGLASEECVSSCAGTDRKRWSWTEWTQDNTGVSYITNPRVTQTRVGDGTNTKRTDITYYTSGGVYPYGLPELVKIYAANTTTVLKTQKTVYNLGSSYTTRRIIGLPSESYLYDGTDTGGTLMSKVTYAYDEGNLTGTDPVQNISPTQHDNTNYSSSFVTGRGLQTSATRWDAAYPTTSGYAVTSTSKYNTAGARVSQTDPLSRTSKIAYADNFNSSGNPSTYAYPTTITDANGQSSTIKYRYDIGTNIEAANPPPTGQSYGKTSKRVLDSLGRMERNSIYVNTTEKSYVRYEYPTNGVQAKSYAPVVDADGDGNLAEDEVYSESWMDGAGRTRRSRTEHPGSTGGWRGTLVEYDILGRVARSSVPTEISVSGDTWTPAGDDYARGWLWTHQKYDWNGRVIRKINTDGDPNTSNDSDVLMSYEGCGCAGGQMTTVEGENIIETAWGGGSPTTLGRRKQKIYQDILGRTTKTEVMEWNGTTVHSTTVNTYNGRDQITNTRQYAGDDTSGTYRDVTMTYDGHGRMKTRHYPIENSGTYTTWDYNSDDSVDRVTDPRGVETDFSYGSATGRLDSIAYTVPSGQASTVPDPGDVTFTYDNLGNRTAMSDGSGSATYTYNSLSQMTQETKSITGLGTTFPINYTYNLTGGLRSLSDPHHATRQVVFNHDKTGRLVGADGRVNSTITTNISNIEYRAWGAIKEYDYVGNDFEFAYDDRLMLSSYEIVASGSLGTQNLTRYADGTLKTVSLAARPQWDRLYKYDFAGRLTKGFTGREANGDTNTPYGPYKQEMTYNAFSETTAMTGKNWNVAVPNLSKSYTGSTGREANTGYDAAGNVVSDKISTGLFRSIKYDAAGRQVVTFDPLLHSCCEVDHTYNNYYDGNGWRVKADGMAGAFATDTEYEIRSTVLGGELVGKVIAHATSPVVYSEFFTPPVLAGTLSFPMGGTSGSGGYSLTGPEGLFHYGGGGGYNKLYDTRGADAGVEEPVASGGGYPGQADTSTFARCAEGGVPQSCDMQARASANADRIEDAIKTDWAKQDSVKHEQGHAGQSGDLPQKAQATKESSPAANETTKTDKPEPNLEKPGTVDPDTVPDASGENDGCIYGTYGGPNACRVQASQGDLFSMVDASAGSNTSINFLAQTRTPCERMAVRAQAVWNENLRAVVKDSNTPPNANFNRLTLPHFDQNFTTLYTGHIVDGSTSSISALALGGGTNSSGAMDRGQQDFKEEFIDSDFAREDTSQGADQVHHFAAYFSAGLNSAGISAYVHRATDTIFGRPIKGANQGDLNLADRAYALGSQVRTSPNIMANIGEVIRNAFCK